MPRLRRLVRFMLIILVSAAVMIYCIVVWTVVETAIHPSPGPTTLDLQAYPDLHPTTVTWTGMRGAHLVGHLFPGASKITIVLSHGYGDTEGTVLPWAQFLHQAGFTVVTYDMRGRGASTGEVTLGALEAQDLVLLVDTLSRRPDVDPRRIGVLGVSLGASVSIMAAAEDQRIRAVVDDSGFSDAQHAIASSFTYFTGVPAWLFEGATLLLAQVRTGVSIRDISPISVVSRIAPRPILIIHGTADRFILPDNSARLYAAAGQPKHIWWVQGAAHTAGYFDEPTQYVQRVTSFFHQAFATPQG